MHSIIVLARWNELKRENDAGRKISWENIKNTRKNICLKVKFLNLIQWSIALPISRGDFRSSDNDQFVQSIVPLDHLLEDYQVDEKPTE